MVFFNRNIWIIITVIFCNLISIPCYASFYEHDIKTLRKGVKKIAKPGIPGPIIVFGTKAFPVISAKTKSNHVVVVGAAGYYGKGKFFAFGHNGYFGSSISQLDTPLLIENILSWMAPKKSNIRIGTRNVSKLTGFLQKQDYSVTSLDNKDWIKQLINIDILFYFPKNNQTSEEIQAIYRFIRSGGGLLVSGLGWGWQQLNPNKSLHDHPGNKLMQDMGIMWGQGYLDTIMPLPEPPLRYLHAQWSLDYLNRLDSYSIDNKTIKMIGTTLEYAIRALPVKDNSLIQSLGVLLQNKSSNIPSQLSPMKNTFDRLMLLLRHQRDLQADPRNISPSPSAYDFPGEVSEHISGRSHIISLSFPYTGWISTGLYAKPGEKVTIILPSDILHKNISVRIGAHSDKLWSKPVWKRHPEITLKHKIKQSKTRITNPHGGLIYLEAEHIHNESITVHIKNVVDAPHFILGKTTLNKWQILRNNPAPWAELETEKIILTIPSAEIRNLDDPKKLMQLWDRVLDLYADLSMIPLANRPQRIVADRQISLGYMHAGYPIMTHIDAAKKMVDYNILLGKPKPEIWGIWHELGHNFQQPDWTFSGTQEVTCNLFTLFILDKTSAQPTPKHQPIQDFLTF